MGEVSLAIDGNVAVITISSPEVRNGLTSDMGNQLVEICKGVNANLSLGSAVIQGARGTFCSGADTRAWSVNTDPASEEAYSRTSAIYASFFEVGMMAVPTIAAIRGAAVGAGMNLALATDLRIVADDARLISGFVRIGIHPGGGFFTLMGRSPGGREAAAAMGIFGQEITGRRAAELGIAWQSLPDEEVEGKALELAHKAAGDPELIRHAIQSIRTELGPPSIPWAAALELERGVQMWSQRRRQINN
ncbi:MAG: enoyl-CoA hydratase/isomerase family protein [Ferrimicrobium sp.]